MSQRTLLTPNWSDTGKYRVSQLTGTEIEEQKLLQEPEAW